MKDLKLTLKEALTVIMFLLGIAGTYFKAQYDIDTIKADNIELSQKIERYNSRLSDYAELPNQVQDMEEIIENIKDMINIIHDGLVAEGIIPPRGR